MSTQTSQHAAKNPRDELQDHLAKNFRQPNPLISQYQDDHIYIELFGGDVQVWNKLNMRYCHQRFLSNDRNRDDEGCYERAKKYFKEEYHPGPQPVPKQYRVVPTKTPHPAEAK